jgi:hypothetical protein
MQQPMMQQPPMKKSRPIGITILAILAILLGLLLLVGGVITMAGGSFLGALFSSAVTDAGISGADASVVGAATSFIGSVLGIGVIIGGLLYLLFGIGAWNLKGWARWLGIIASFLSVIGLGCATLQAMTGGLQVSGVQIIELVIPVLIFIYLLTPGVAKAFSKN